MTQKSILLIEDDARLAAMIKEYLENAGFNVTHAATGATGLAEHKNNPEKAIVLDLMLPDMDGLDVCRKMREHAATTPILMLTARGDAMDRVIGLELGADDYLPKPFEPRELLARLNAILRRTAPTTAAPGTDTDIMRFGHLEIDRGAREVRVNGTTHTLTGHQFDLLVVMAEHAGRVLSREQIMDIAKGEDLEAFDRSIDVHISRIRHAIEDDPKHPKRIITVRGAGYLFAKSQDEQPGK